MTLFGPNYFSLTVTKSDGFDAFRERNIDKLDINTLNAYNANMNVWGGGKGKYNFLLLSDIHITAGYLE